MIRTSTKNGRNGGADHTTTTTTTTTASRQQFLSSPLLLRLLLLLLLCSRSALLDVTAVSRSDVQQKALLLLAPSTTRSIWSFAGIISNHSTTILPPSIPQPPPRVLGYYNSYPLSSFQPAHLNGRDQYIDLTNPLQDGGSRVFTGPVGNGTKSWALSTWLYVESLTHAGNVNQTVLLSCSSGKNLNPPRDFMIVIDTQGRIGLPAVGSAGGGNTPVYIYPWIDVNGLPMQTLKEWIHIGMVFNFNNQKYTFYYNGAYVGTLPLATFGASGFDTQANYCKLGQSDLTVLAGNMQPFRGAFFGLALYQGELLTQQDMWILAAPRSAKAILEMTPYTWKSWAAPPSPTTPNQLTSDPNFLWSQYSTLSLSATSLDLSSQSPNPVLITNKIGGTQPWAVAWWQHLSGIPSTVSTVWSFTNSSAGDLLAVTTSSTAIQFTHTTLGTWNAFPITAQGSYGGTLTAVTQWAFLSLTSNGTTFTSYINGYPIWSFTPTLMPTGPRSFSTMYIGKSSGVPANFVGQIFGFSIWNSATSFLPALDTPEMEALAEPTMVMFNIDGPKIVSPGSNIILKLSTTSNVKEGSVVLSLQGGASSSVSHDALFTTTTTSVSQIPQILLFLVPLGVNTYTITFINSANDPLIRLPPPWCVQVVNASPAMVVDVGLTSFTATEFLASSDYHLELSSIEILPTSNFNIGPSGLSSQVVLLFDGSSQYLNLSGSMNTMPFTGFVDSSDWTVTMWIQIKSRDSLPTPIFYHAVNAPSDSILINIEPSTGAVKFQVIESQLIVCTAFSDASFPVGQDWHHLTAQMGNGGCSVFIDGQQSFSSNTITSYTSSWNPSWQPLQQQQPPTTTLIGFLRWIYPTLNGSLASFDVFQRALTPREIAFLAANKPTSLLPPLSTPRIITIPNVMSAEQLYDDALVGLPIAWSPVSTHATSVSGPNSGNLVWKFSNTTYGLDLFSPADTPLRGSMPKGMVMSKRSGWSVGIWIMPEQIVAGAYIFNILSGVDSIASLTTSSNAELVFNMTIGGAKTVICSVRSTFAILGATSVSVQQWVHVHAAYDPLTPTPTCAIYVNGRMAGISQITIDPTSQSLTGFVLGSPAVSAASPNSKWVGRMTSFIFFTRVVTKQEIFILGNSPLSSLLPPVLPSNLASPAERIAANSDFDWIPTGQIMHGVPGVDLSGGIDLPDTPRVLSYSGVIGSGYTDLLIANGASTSLTYSFPPFRSPSVTVSMWASWSGASGCFFYTSNSDSSSILSIRPDPIVSAIILMNVTHCDPATPGVCVQVCSLSSYPAMPTGTTMYHLVAMVADDGSCKIYINGILASTSSGGDIKNAPLFGMRTMIPTIANVGACASSDPQRLNGKVAQLTIWQRELSDMEIAVLAAEPPLSVRSLFPSLQQYYPLLPTPIVDWTFPRDGVNYQITAGGYVSINSVNNQSIDLIDIFDNFNVINNVTVAKALPLAFGGMSQSFTISIWVAYFYQLIQSNQQIFECSSADRLHSVRITLDGNYAYGVDIKVLNYGDTRSSQPNAFTPGKWHLLTAVFDAQSSTFKLMVNSAVVLSQAYASGIMNLPRLVTHNFCRIGAASNPVIPRLSFNLGYVAFHNIALQPADVLTMFRNPPVNVIPLITQDSMIDRLFSSAAASYLWPDPPVPSSSPPAYSGGGILTFTPNATTFAPQYLLLHKEGSNPGPFGNFLPVSSISNVINDGLTISMWLKFSSTANNQRVLDFVTETKVDTRFSIQFNKGVVTIVVKIAGQSTCTLAFPSFIAKVNTWNLYTVMLFPDARGQLYVDTTLYDSPSSSMQCVTSSSTNVAQTLLLPFSAYASAYFGGPPSVVDGVNYRGFSGSLVGLNYFTRQLLPSEITLLYQNPPQAGMTVPTGPISSSSYSWRFQISSQSDNKYSLVAAKNVPGTYAKLTKNTFLNLTLLSDRPENDILPTYALGGKTGTSTVFSMWMRFDGLGSQFVLPAVSSCSLFDFSMSSTNYNGHLVLWLRLTSQNQTYLQFDQVSSTGFSSMTLKSPPGIIAVGEWKLITLVLTLGVSHPIGSNVRLYINAGLIAMSSSAYAQSIPITRALVNQNPDSASSGLSISLADVTILDSAAFYTHDMVLQAFLNPPKSLLGTALKLTPSDQLLLSAAALYTCSQRIVKTTSIMERIPGRSAYSGLCVFDKQLATASNALTNGSYWNLTNPNDNPDNSILPIITTDPFIVGDGSGLTFSFHMSLQRLPSQGEVMPLFTCKPVPSITGSEISILMAYSTPTTTSFSFAVRSLPGISPFIFLNVNLSNSEIPKDEVIHLAFTIIWIDPTPYWAARIYFNGRQLGSSPPFGGGSGGVNVVSLAQRDICFFGLNKAYPLAGATSQFLGSVGQIAYFSRGLSVNEIKLLAINPPSAYVTPTTVASIQYSGDIEHYSNRPMTCGTRTLQTFQTWDSTNPTVTTAVPNLAAMQCATPTIVTSASQNLGRLNSTLIDCIRNTLTIPVGESLTYLGNVPSEARLDVNPIWFGVESNYIKTGLEEISVLTGDTVNNLVDTTYLLTPPSSPLSISTYQLFFPVLPVLPTVWIRTYCVSPCLYYYKGVLLGNGLTVTKLTGLNVGVNVVKLTTTTFAAQGYLDYSLTLLIPQPDPCVGVVCGNGATCLPQASQSYPGYLYTCQCAGLFTGPLCQDVIPTPSNPPVAVMFISQTVTDCDILYLDGRQSYNLGPSSLHPRWIWGLASIKTAAGVEIFNTSNPKYDPVVAQQTFAGAQPNTLNASTVFEQTDLISILGSRLINNCKYRFYLAILNDIDQSKPVSKDVTKQQTAQVGWTPSMVVRVPTNLRRPNSATTTATLTPSTCLAYPLDLQYSYTWQAQITGALYPPSAYYPAINSLPANQALTTSPASSFVVPAGFWRTGYTYTISLNLILSSASGIISPTQRRRLLASQSVALNYLQANLTVTSTAVIAKITNGDRTRANTDELIITADQSYDPDFPLSTGQSPLIGVTFMWSCRVSGGVGCALPVTVNLTRPSVTIPPSTLSAGFSYIWSVNVTSIMDGRSSVSSSVNVTLTVPLTVSVPLVTILAPPTRINIDDELRVQATVVSETTTNPIAMSYVWSIRLDNSSMPAVPPLPSLYDPTNLANGVGVNTSSLVLLSNRLVSGIYRLTVTVTDPFTIDPVSKLPVSGYANIVFRVNSKPQPGECHISATTTTSGGYYALLTPFSVVCSSWYSNTGDEPFTYQISYVTSEAVAAAAANAANTPVSYLQLTPESFAPTSVQFFLPAAGSFIIRATIKDQVGSEANVDLPLTVDTPIVVFDLLEYIRNLTEVELPPLVASGSTQSAMLLASRIGDLINGARVTMSSSGSGSGNSSSDSSSSSSSSDTDINAAAQDRLTLYNRECLIQLSLTWKQIMIQTHNIIDLASMNLIIQAMLPLTKYASSSTTTPPRYYSNDTLTVALQLIGDVITAADLSTMTHKILSISTTQDLGTILSQLFVECSSLDFIDHSLHTVLHIRQRDAVAGEEISLSTLNFIGFVSRSLVSAGTEVHLSNGQSVILTSKQMETYVAQLEQLNSTSIDTASYPLGTAEMDTRIITFASQWNQCRNKASLSQLTSIELTFPNGDPIDIGSLGSGITFTLPLPKNVSDPILQLIQDDQRRQYEERCGTSDGFIPTNVTEDELLSHFQCQFYNTTTHQYSSDGCTTLNATRVDPPGLGGGGGVLLTCQCTHLTEFAILYQEAQSRDRNDGCPATATSLGDSSYLIFLVLYALVGLAALIQLIRSIVFFGVKKYWLITIEHTLMFLMCLARSFNMAMYYTLYTKLSIFTQSLLSGIPYLFYPWIFTFVIVAWASVLAAASQGQHRKNLFKPYAVQFILGNSVVSLVIFFIFISMAMTNDLDTLTQLQRAGIGVTCAVEIGFAIFFVIYGGLLVHELTKTFVSKHAWRLGAVAGSLASAFAISAALLAFSVAQPEKYDEYFVAYNCVYFTLDIIGLLIVMALFAKSISRAGEGSKTKEVSSTGNGSSHRTATNGAKASSGGCSSNYGRNGSSKNDDASKKDDLEMGAMKREPASKLSVPRALPASPVSSPSVAASPTEQEGHVQQYTPLPEEQILQISPPQSPHHQLEVNDSAALPDGEDDDDVPLPPPPKELQQLHQQSTSSHQHQSSSPPPLLPHQQHSSSPPPLPSSMVIPPATPASPSLTGSKRPPPPIPVIQQTPASPSQAASRAQHDPVELDQVQVEQQQLQEDDF